MKLDEELLTGLLERWPVARMATLTPAGNAHVLPVVFTAWAGHLYIPVDGKRKSGAPLARVRNIQANGHASLLLDNYLDDWSRLWWVKLDGPAWIDAGPGELTERVGGLLRRKYPQYRTIAPLPGESMLLVVRWTRTAAWTQAGDDEPIRRAAGVA